MIWTVLQVGAGGAVGAMMRFLAGHYALRFTNGGFPVAVLGVNILGSFLMGVLVVWLGKRGLTHLAPLLMTGVLGGFTTFSAFSLEAVTLYERGAMGQAAIYIALSVGGSLLALIAGLALARGTMV